MLLDTHYLGTKCCCTFHTFIKSLGFSMTSDAWVLKRTRRVSEKVVGTPRWGGECWMGGP